MGFLSCPLLFILDYLPNVQKPEHCLMSHYFFLGIQRTEVYFYSLRKYVVMSGQHPLKCRPTEEILLQYAIATNFQNKGFLQVTANYKYRCGIVTSSSVEAQKCTCWYRHPKCALVSIFHCILPCSTRSEMLNTTNHDAWLYSLIYLMQTKTHQTQWNLCLSKHALHSAAQEPQNMWNLQFQICVDINIWTSNCMQQ